MLYITKILLDSRTNYKGVRNMSRDDMYYRNSIGPYSKDETEHQNQSICECKECGELVDREDN